MITALACVIILATIPTLGLATSPPTASFTYTPSTPNPDDPITLDASDSVDDDGDIVSYKWDTDGDGEYSEYRYDATDGETTTVSYGTGGTYTVGLKVEDSSGNTETVTKQITVENPSPEASFSYSPSTPNPDDSITLDASSSSDTDGDIVSYKWDTDGDGEYSEYRYDAPDGQTTTVSYGTGGTYTVGLKVEDNGGKTDTITKQIRVENPSPSASFSYSPSTPNPDDSITLDASSSSDPDGSIVSYKWDTDGDGEYSEYRYDAPDGQTATVSYDTGGTYTVRLKIKDNGGKTDTVTRKISVENPAPKAAFDYSPSTPNPDDSITLDASRSSDPDGSIVSYTWDTDGDGEYSEYRYDAPDGQTTTVSYDTGGTYTVGLKIKDNGGKTDTITRQITVENPAPDADFKYSTQRSNGLTVDLDGSSSTDADGQIESYEWYVDGRRVKRGQTPSMTFREKGRYDIRLVVTDNGGVEDEITKEIGVSNSPIAQISAPDRPVASGSEILFRATPSHDPDGSIESYEWEFSDGTTEEGLKATKEFGETGEYSVSLTVVDDTGNRDTTRTTIQIESPPDVTIAWSPDAPKDDEPIQLNASSEDTIESWRWDFDNDGTTDETGRSVTHAFPDGGTKNIKLTVVRSDELEWSTQKSLAVREVNPNADFDWNPTSPRSGFDVNFTVTSTDGNYTYNWDLDGDGTMDASGKNVTYSYFTTGEKTAVLNATDEHGDTGQTTTNVTVKPGLEFGVKSNNGALQVGDAFSMEFQIANHHPDSQIQGELQLEFPRDAIEISSIERATGSPHGNSKSFQLNSGDEENFQVKFRVNKPGNHNISGNAVYTIGDQQSGSQKTALIGSATFAVEEPLLGISLPAIGGIMGLILSISGILYFRTRI